MTRNIPIIAVVIIGIVTFAELIFFTYSPIIYDQVNSTAETSYHVNTEFLESQPINSTTDVTPLMQNLLDLSERIIHDIRVRDPERTQADLVNYNGTTIKLENLVTNQNMQTSDIGKFTSSANTQYQILLQLEDETATLDTLKNQEIRYGNSQDPNMLFWINNQADSLQKSLNGLFASYVNEQAKIQSIDTKLGLETTEYNQSTLEFQNIISEVNSFENSTSRSENFLSASPTPSVDIEPTQATYGDTFFVFGHVGSIENAGGVDVYIDKILLQHFTPDVNGNYIGSYTVEKIKPGVHEFVAKVSGINSTPVVLDILPTNSTTTLNAQIDTKNSAVICSGTIVTNQPPRYVPFTIFDGDRPIFSGITNNNGEFNVSVFLPPGTHTLSAGFISPAYPINTSKSNPVIVNIPTTLNPLVGIVTIIASILVVSLGGAIMYLRQKKTFRPAMTIPVHTPVTESSPDTLTPDNIWVNEPVFSCYEMAQETQGISEEAYLAYRKLVGRLAKHHHIKEYLTHTPLEIVNECPDVKERTVFSRFVSAYEKIRYAGGRSAEDWAEFRESLYQVDNNIRGDHD